jgi:hypothetical protein
LSGTQASAVPKGTKTQSFHSIFNFEANHSYPSTKKEKSKSRIDVLLKNLVLLLPATKNRNRKHGKGEAWSSSPIISSTAEHEKHLFCSLML